jgi:hypothetical protein
MEALPYHWDKFKEPVLSCLWKKCGKLLQTLTQFWNAFSLPAGTEIAGYTLLS